MIRVSRAAVVLLFAQCLQCPAEEVSESGCPIPTSSPSCVHLLGCFKRDAIYFLQRCPFAKTVPQGLCLLRGGQFHQTCLCRSIVFSFTFSSRHPESGLGLLRESFLGEKDFKTMPKKEKKTGFWRKTGNVQTYLEQDEVWQTLSALPVSP